MTGSEQFEIKIKFDEYGEAGFVDKYEESWCYEENGKDKLQVLLKDGRSLEIDLPTTLSRVTLEFVCEVLAEGDELEYNIGFLANV